VAGVASSNLRKRIEHIMRNASARRLTRRSKLLLTAASVVVIAMPVAVGALTAPRSRAQAVEGADAPRVEFEVASIKPNMSGPGPIMFGAHPGGRFTATNVTVRMLIQTAYRLQPSQVTGGPDWLNTDRFDIVAKGDDSDHDGSLGMTSTRPASRIQLMLRSLLADRFKLVVRTETRDLPIYALTLARSDGKPGPALHPSTVDCTTPRKEDAPDVLKLPMDPANPPPCGIRLGVGSMLLGGAGLSQLATTLSGVMDRTVVDRTQLSGAFDVRLTWTPDQATPKMAQKMAFAPAVDRDGPSIFTAVQEQLGLKLEPTSGPVEMLVIISAQPPTAN
jgi:uncharacterized protein (TIGR03435 family)